MIVGILLAAGRGQRFQAESPVAVAKVLAPLVDGTPLIIRSALNLLPAVECLLCVVRTEDGALQSVLTAYEYLFAGKLQIVLCPHAELGMAESIKAGIAASADASAWLLAFADMPFIQPHTIVQIAAQVQHADDICVPVYGGEDGEQQGHPVAFGSAWRESLLQLQGDRGARAILQHNPDKVIRVTVNDVAIGWDVDTPADLLGYQQLIQRE